MSRDTCTALLVADCCSTPAIGRRKTAHTYRVLFLHYVTGMLLCYMVVTGMLLCYKYVTGMSLCNMNVTMFKGCYKYVTMLRG